MKWLAARPDSLLLAALIAALIALSAAITRAAGLELHYDEAQYWEWSQQLDWSYYSKGPLIAWLIALSTALFGHGEWQVRLFGWLIHGLFVAAIFGFARDISHSRAAAWWAVVLAVTTPLYFILGLVMTTDSLLLLFWTLGLWAVYRALIRQQRKAWYAAGAAVGIGALTKLSIGLLPAFVGIVVLLRKPWRHHLRDPHLWGGILLVFACMSPLLYWNALHDWVMFRHELGHVEHSGSSLDRMLEFIASQIVALSPLVVAVAVVALRRTPADKGQRFLLTLSAALFAFFLYKAFNTKVQVNWAAACYVGALVVFAARIPELTPARRRILGAGVATSALMITLMLFPHLVGLHASEFAPIKKLQGWREPVRQVSAHAGDVNFVLAEDYTVAAEAAFYWPTRVPVYVIASHDRRFNQHDLWPGIAREQGGTGVVILHNDEELPELVRSAFATCTALPVIEARDAEGEIYRTLHSFRCEQYRHIEWPTPQSY